MTRDLLARGEIEHLVTDDAVHARGDLLQAALGFTLQLDLRMRVYVPPSQFLIPNS
jgi:hypothetical protein